eukprot:TRINITY_DN7086_c0_g1_i1.p1 TRINITY_DN7086_c0_g1~~TRINITY_DN7086_c0_g1_i1.p1  ORF type:complete len:561 (+),score=137.81 TRINITY_DN7086_c0_g1_i1:87-1769(+)
MNVVKALRDYIGKMVRITGGMKVLLLDSETSGIVSMVYTQSEVLQEETYLFERLDTQNREVMAHLKAICFIRPTAENINLLKKELRKPKYGEYYIFFTNVISKNYLEQLAAADEHEVVHEVQEFFGDYYAVNPDCWSLNLSPSSCISVGNSPPSEAIVERIVEGLFSCLLSLKIRPYIRVQKSSTTAKMIGNSLLERMKQNKSLFTFRAPEVPPVLVILDRFDDPVTPLLSQWTYQAMIHEMIGVEKNLVDLSKCSSNTKKEVAQVVLSPEQDPFYKENMYKNFGELGISIRSLVDNYSAKSKLNSNIQTLDDMKEFVKNYPEFKKLSGSVTKHMAIMTELQAQVAQRNLLDVSELEQTLACHENHEQALEAINGFFANNKVKAGDMLRLVMLYSLRYQNTPGNQTSRFLSMLKDKGCSEADVKSVKQLIAYGGSEVRSKTIDLFGQSFFAKATGDLKRGLMGVTNIYTQHQPLLSQTVDDIIKGTLPELSFPFLEGAPTKAKPQNVLIFMTGGITYEEAFAVNGLNASSSTNVLLGGTSILNSTQFINALNSTSSEQGI